MSNDIMRELMELDNDYPLTPEESVKRGESPDSVQASIIKYPGMIEVKVLSINLRVLYSPKIFTIEFEDERFKTQMKKEGVFSKNFTRMIFSNALKAFKLHKSFIWTAWANVRIGIKTYTIHLKQQDITIKNDSSIVTLKIQKEPK